MRKIIATIFLVLAGCATYHGVVHESAHIEIIKLESANDAVLITFELVNDGDRPFSYRGHEETSVVPMREFRSWRGWRSGGFVCYTEMGEFQVAPNQRRRFQVRESRLGRVRIGIEDSVRGGVAWSSPFLIARPN